MDTAITQYIKIDDIIDLKNLLHLLYSMFSQYMLDGLLVRETLNFLYLILNSGLNLQQ